MYLNIPTVEEGEQPLIRNLHWHDGLVIVSFFFGELGVM